MSTTSSAETPGSIGILSGGFGAIRAAPILIGLFLLSGITKLFLPFPLDAVARIVVVSVGALLAYRAFGGTERTDKPMYLRLFMAGIATLITYSLLIVGIYSTAFSGIGLYVFLLLLIPGLYVYARLFLSVPAVMVEGYGPFEALSASWRLTNDAGLAVVGAVLAVFGGAVSIVLAVYLWSQSLYVVNVGGILLADMPLTGMQAFLYATLTDPV